MIDTELKTFRKKYKITQKELSKLTDYSIDSIRSMETGRRSIMPPFEKILFKMVEPKLKKRKS